MAKAWHFQSMPRDRARCNGKKRRRARITDAWAALERLVKADDAVSVDGRLLRRHHPIGEGRQRETGPWRTSLRGTATWRQPPKGARKPPLNGRFHDLYPYLYRGGGAPAGWPLTLPAVANGKPNGERRDGPCNSAFPLGGECRGKCDADGCRLGSDGRGDLARHGRPAHRAALARSRRP